MARSATIANRTNTITPDELNKGYRDLQAVEKEIDRLTGELAGKRAEKGGIFRRLKKAGADNDALKNVIRLARLDDDERNRLRENEENYASILGIPLWRAGTAETPQGALFGADQDEDALTAQANQEGYNARYDEVSFDACPYEKDSIKQRGWAQGWKHGDQEIEARAAAANAGSAKPNVKKAAPARKAGGKKGAPAAAHLN